MSSDTEEPDDGRGMTKEVNSGGAGKVEATMTETIIEATSQMTEEATEIGNTLNVRITTEGITTTNTTDGREPEKPRTVTYGMETIDRTCAMNPCTTEYR